AYAWVLFQTTGDITGFDPAKFNIMTTPNEGTAGFSNAFANHFRIKQSGNNLVLTYEGLPNVKTKSATNIASTTAVINGLVKPCGIGGTAWFEYGTTTNYGSTVAIT